MGDRGYIPMKSPDKLRVKIDMSMVDYQDRNQKKGLGWDLMLTQEWPQCVSVVGRFLGLEVVPERLC
jgi:hypothetical protein